MNPGKNETVAAMFQSWLIRLVIFQSHNGAVDIPMPDCVALSQNLTQ